MERVNGVCSAPVWSVVTVSMSAIQVSSAATCCDGRRAARRRTRRAAQTRGRRPHRASDAEMATENEEHLVLLVMVVPGELALDLCYFDVLDWSFRKSELDLTHDSRRPKL